MQSQGGDEGVRPGSLSVTEIHRGTFRGVPRDGLGGLEHHSLAVFAHDRAALWIAYLELNAARFWQVSAWSGLNNTKDSAGIADQVVTCDLDGLVGERVANVGTGIPGDWQPALDPRGSLLSPPRALPPAARRFDVSRRARHSVSLH